MNKLEQILEDGLQAIERGDTIEAVIHRYPKFADELRPLLEAAVSVKNKSLFEVPSAVVRRNRAKLLQQAAKMRAGRVKRESRSIWFLPLRRAFVTSIVLMLVFASGTNLVRASSSTLPGDRLYLVKRTLENVLVFVTVDSQKREVLELEQENNRLGELQQLFEKRRSAPVDFSGLVATQDANQWSVSGVNVLISSQTKLPQNTIEIGTGVHVIGYAQNGIVQAEAVELISLNKVEVASQVSTSSDSNSNTNSQHSTPESAEPVSTQTPSVAIGPIETVKPGSQSSNSFKGITQSLGGNIWIINGVRVNVSMAEISGTLANGVVAKVEGYFDHNGVFIAKRIELPEDNNNNNNNSGNNTSSGSGGVSPSATPGQNHDENKHVTETPENHQNDNEYHHPTKTPESQQYNNNNNVYITKTPEPEH